MCRCCQSCLEELYWNCIEERFCYDESIANYNPDEDEYVTKKNGILLPIQQNDNNNTPICTQPVANNCPVISSKIHEEDYRREIQTSVPILAPEILTVFANSQIFQDHPPKLGRSLTKTHLPLISNKNKENDQEKLLKRLEGEPESLEDFPSSEKKIFHFTISSDSSPELKRSLSPHQFTSIIEESEDNDTEEVILRPRGISESKATLVPTREDKKTLRSVQSVPYFSLRPASENDIFFISGTLSMTPEVPSISYSTLPKNYEDTPTLEKYKESVSLYSIQTANQAKAIETDYSMPRYFRKSTFIGQSTENIPAIREELSERPEKSKRLKHLRGSLPPLLINSVRLKREDSKHAD